jgi:hypothetical protein
VRTGPDGIETEVTLLEGAPGRSKAFVFREVDGKVYISATDPGNSTVVYVIGEDGTHFGGYKISYIPTPDGDLIKRITYDDGRIVESRNDLNANGKIIVNVINNRGDVQIIAPKDDGSKAITTYDMWGNPLTSGSLRIDKEADGSVVRRWTNSEGVTETKQILPPKKVPEQPP